ncbi:MAG: flagellar protein FlaG [Burkholderiales bacterium]|jgi:flagellar protein FlaG|nr:flagellar protein FlaG [Burkholderiales bacterium]
MSNGPVTAVGQAVPARPAAVSSQAAAQPPAPLPQPATQPAEPSGTAQMVGPDAQSVREAVDRINAFLKSAQRDLNIEIDKDTGIVVVKVVDRESGEVIRQIPPEETLAIAKNLDTAQGVLFRSRV